MAREAFDTEVRMRQHQLIRRLILLLTFGYILVGSAAGQSELSPEQKQKLKLFEAKLRAVPGRPASTDEHLPVVQENFRDLLALTSRPSREPADNLTRTLVLGISTGTITVPQSIGLTRELAKVLSQPKITPGTHSSSPMQSIRSSRGPGLTTPRRCGCIERRYASFRPRRTTPTIKSSRCMVG